MSYAELFCLTNYSFLKAGSHPHEMIDQAVALGYEALAITDECSLAGVVRAYEANKAHAKSPKEPLKLIVGSHFYNENLGTLVLLAPHRKAYGALSTLITQARQRAKKGQYQVYLEDFIATKLDCLLIWLPVSQTAVDDYGEQLKAAFKDRFWLGYRRIYQADDGAHYQRLRRWQQQLSCHVVAVGGVHIHSVEAKPRWDLLQAIRLGQPLTMMQEHLASNAEARLRTLNELQACYPEAWLQETLMIASQCHFCLSELSYEYPAELVPAGMTASDYLFQLTMSGAKQRFPHGIKPEIQEKLDKELKLIGEQRYEYFFLTISDLVQFAKKRGILYQGRGSAANSVVCYCLEITAVNPDQIDVLFERFISKERDEPPDIDVDFEHQRREEVIQYIYQKYSRQRAALAATVICYRTRSAFRDVGKALGFAEAQLEQWLAKIDKRDKSIPWQQQLVEIEPDITKTTPGRMLLQWVDAIRGFPRHLSQHVGGFVISAGPLAELVPIENAAMPERTVIQWDKDDLETLGLLKVDVLALGMLSAIRKSFDWIRRIYQHDYDLARVPVEDPNVYQMLQSGDSIGVFQVESRAQMTMLPRLKPATFYDLVIQIAIVRPGPIQGDMVHPYLRRRDGLETVDYPSEAVAGVLKRTLGVPIFQEQVIKIAMVAAGFSGGEADQLRRAMANWKRTGALEKFEPKLIQGMLERGYKLEFAERIFQQICGFGEYGFPESHSASFANLAYVSAWLKHYYPAAFYVGLLNSLPMGFYSASQLIQDARRHQVMILPVCIESSDWDHQLVAMHDNIVLRLGFRQIKGLQQERMEALLQKRPKDGFKSLIALQKAGLNHTDLERLASADALQRLGGHRYQTRWQALAMPDQQLPLLQDLPLEQDMNLPAPTEVADVGEDYHTLGLSLRRHPILLLREQGLLKGCYTAAELPSLRHRQVVRIAGLVTCRQRPGTSSGVTFITLEDETGNANIVVWLRTAQLYKQAYLKAQLLQVKGLVEISGQVVHVIAAELLDRSDLLGQATVRSRDFH